MTTPIQRLATLLVLIPLTGCLTAPPAHVPAPDERLEGLLGELRSARGGSFEADAAERNPSLEARLRREVEAVTMTSSRYVPALVASGALAYERGDAIGAQKYLDQALALDPRHVRATLLRVRIAAEAGNLPYARRALLELIDLYPDEPDLREAYAGVLFLLGEHGDALSELDLADRFREGDDLRWRTDYHRGLILHAQGDAEGAGQMFRRSHEAKTDFEPAARRLRWVEAAAGEGVGES